MYVWIICLFRVLTTQKALIYLTPPFTVHTEQHVPAPTQTCTITTHIEKQKSPLQDSPTRCSCLPCWRPCQALEKYGQQTSWFQSSPIHTYTLWYASPCAITPNIFQTLFYGNVIQHIFQDILHLHYIYKQFQA